MKMNDIKAADLKPLEEKIKYEFKDKDLLALAVTHKSFSAEHRAKKENNEKLEFLGDAVLDFILSEILYLAFPDDDEGILSKKRASLVNEEVLAILAKKLELDKFLKMGKGEVLTGGDKKPRLLASAFEALSGAIFLDGGYTAVKRYLIENFQPEISNLNLEVHYAKDFKTRLQEIIQKKFKMPPQYQLISESGPAHDKAFAVQVVMGDKILGIGQGKTKKEAEQMAAEKAIKEVE